MDKDDLREAWSKIQRCYQLDKVDPDPHTIEFLEQTSNLREDLYRRCPPEGGGGTTNPGTTSKNCRQSFGRRGDCGGSSETPDGTGRRTISHEGRIPECMAPGGNQGEIPRHQEVGQIGEYNIGSVPVWIHPGGNDMDDDGNYTKGWRVVQRYRDS